MFLTLVPRGGEAGGGREGGEETEARVDGERQREMKQRYRGKKQRGEGERELTQSEL